MGICWRKSVALCTSSATTHTNSRDTLQKITPTRHTNTGNTIKKISPTRNTNTGNTVKNIGLRKALHSLCFKCRVFWKQLFSRIDTKRTIAQTKFSSHDNGKTGHTRS